MGKFVQLTEENMDREKYGTFPHALYRLEKYRQVLSNDSILLYGILKDRLNLSFMNDMRDRNGQVFIIASLECICEKLNVSTSTARKLVRELENADLLRIEKCEGYNASRRFYLGDVNRDEDNSSDENCQKDKLEINSSGDENYHKEGVKSNTSKGEKLNPNKPDLNNPDINNPNINKDKPKAKESYKGNYKRNYKRNYNKGYKKNYHKGNYNNLLTDDNGKNDNSNYEYLKPFNFEDF
ncbi:replication initiator protein A [Clostridium sp.]|uniref:replication initiator protein A n=1 Tax=Clostridium sp. TaxID=1506 RepID=UPI003216E914